MMLRKRADTPYRRLNHSRVAPTIMPSLIKAFDMHRILYRFFLKYTREKPACFRRLISWYPRCG